VPSINVRRLAACGFILAATAAVCPGQYVERRSYEPSLARYIAAGVFARDFKPRASNDAPDSLLIRYTRLMPFVMLRQGPVDLSFGYAQYPLGGRTKVALFLGAVYTNDVLLSGSRESALVLPILLAADFSKSESAGSDRDHFNVGSVGIGTGLKYRLEGEDVDFSCAAAGVIHYSFEGYNIRSASSTAVLGEVTALFRTIRIAEGIAAGYRFRLQSWSTSGAFDYRTVNHGLFVGVMF
jgi:hypothetical protein